MLAASTPHGLTTPWSLIARDPGSALSPGSPSPGNIIPPLSKGGCAFSPPRSLLWVLAPCLSDGVRDILASDPPCGCRGREAQQGAGGVCVCGGVVMGAFSSCAGAGLAFLLSHGHGSFEGGGRPSGGRERERGRQRKLALSLSLSHTHTHTLPAERGFVPPQGGEAAGTQERQLVSAPPSAAISAPALCPHCISTKPPHDTLSAVSQITF